MQEARPVPHLYNRGNTPRFFYESLNYRNHPRGIGRKGRVEIFIYCATPSSISAREELLRLIEPREKKR